MFKLPDTPSPRACAHELADYAEYVCWQKAYMSTTALVADLGRLAENDYGAEEPPDIDEVDGAPDQEIDSTNGIPEEEKIIGVVEEAYREIERREVACRGGYPFTLDEVGQTLRVQQASDNHKHDIYKYLLLATRLNMNRSRYHAEVDGTLLLEELAAEAAQSYFGPRSEKFVFGTSARSPGFSAKVNELCERIQEGVQFMSRSQSRTNKQDDKLDVVAWIPFADNLPGKLIAFGQCKTGTNYSNTLTQLQPDAFCKKWLHTQPVIYPIRMFFVAEALPRLDWENVGIEAGLLFDRCRIVDYCDSVSAKTLAKVRAWTEAAAEVHLLDT